MAAAAAAAMHTDFRAHGAVAAAPQQSWNPLSRDMLHALEDAILAELMQKQQQLQSQQHRPQQSLPQQRAAQEDMNIFVHPPQQVFAPPPGLVAAWPHGTPTRPPPGLPTPPHLLAFEPAKLRSAPCETPETASTADTSEEPPSPTITPLAGPSFAPSVPELRLDGDVPPPPSPVDAECPSVGSMGHRLGLCTPCDFVNRGFCRSGAACQFCHLCGPAERKARKLQRRKIVRAVARENAAAHADD